MSNRNPVPISRKRERSKPAQQNTAKELRVVIAVALFVASSVGAWVVWEQLFPIPPEKLVKVYRVHGCKCVFSWAKALETAGFTVKVQEMETLENVRASLHTPESMRGCHVAKYLDYFVEGHVFPEALRKLAYEHPQALGVATQATTKTGAHVNAFRDENSPVILVGAIGQPQLWFSPKE